jgi:tetratricopeptide (TPR) repeat protein
MGPNSKHGPSDHQETPPEVPAAEYIKEAREHLRGGRRREAYGILLRAGVVHPGHPVILSYLGWLQAAVDKKYKTGLAACRKALALFKTADPQNAARVYPVLYLNLGLAYLAAGSKKDAVDCFRKGLQYDRHHAELKRELRGLGLRKPPPIPFLSRSNILNRIVGKMSHKRS